MSTSSPRAAAAALNFANGASVAGATLPIAPICWYLTGCIVINSTVYYSVQGARGWVRHSMSLCESSFNLFTRTSEKRFENGGGFVGTATATAAAAVRTYRRDVVCRESNTCLPASTVECKRRYQNITHII